MRSINTLAYVYNKTECNRLYQIFNHDFHLSVANKQEDFLDQHKNKDVGILCYCDANESDLHSLLELKGITHLPVIICSKNLNPNFVSKGAQEGLNRFVLCDMSREKINSEIYSVIQEDGLRNFVNGHLKNGSNLLYAKKIVREILYRLPQQMSIRELAESQNISSRWLQSIFKKEFEITYTQLMRRIRVFQGLKLMMNTKLDNTEIALQLRYSDENSLYRIFKKELDMSPSEARNKLLSNSPEALLN